jgi:hypothetical protein
VPFPYQTTARDACYELGLYVNDARLLRATALGTTPSTFTCATVAALTANTLVGSELFPWDMPASPSALYDPFGVTANNAGDITLDHAVGGTAFGAGNRAVLQNIAGKGYPQHKKEWALKMATMEVYRNSPVAYVENASPSVTDYWNTIPATLRSIFRVTQFVASANYEVEISPSTWQGTLDVAGRRVLLPFAWQSGDKVRFYGRTDPVEWWTLLRNVDNSLLLSGYSTAIPCDSRRLVMAAVSWLLNGRRDEHAEKMVEFDYQRASRETAMDRPYPNEVFFAGAPLT